MSIRGTAVFLFFAFIIANAANSDHEQGMKLLRSGKHSEAVALLRKAYKGHKDDSRIAFDYACVASCSTAVEIFNGITESKSASDSLKAAAWSRLGDYSFVYSAFKTAAEKYRKASKIDPNPWYKHQWALALAALPEDKDARSIWHTLTLEYGTDLALKAQYHIGLLDMQAQHYDSAMNRFSNTGPINDQNAWSIAAAAAKLECAIKLGKKKETKKLEKELAPYRDLLLEQDLLKMASFSHSGASKKSDKKKKKRHKKADIKAAGDYTLQVGAFGSVENATALQEKLEKKFDNVSVVPVTLSDQVFYRVRIGSFSSREEAETFGEESLEKEGIAFKSVQK